MVLRNRIKSTQALLAPYAVPIAGIQGREHSEDPDSTRFPFQRDRDRIIHTQAFRRLKGKTQVFVAPEGDHYRTRLTHTLEVAQLSRDIARTLKLNEDLAECIALAHDLGHPPFGHAGEEALDAWMQQHDRHFEHNLQSHRIVTTLEEHSSLHPGLNLNQEVLDGLLKHSTPHDSPSAEHEVHPTLEAQVVNLADEIAYTAHDTDDGLRAGLFALENLSSLVLISRALAEAEKSGRHLRSVLTHLIVTDLYEETGRQIAEQKISSLDDVLASRSQCVRFSEALREELAELRSFLWNHMYLSEAVQTKSREGQEILTALCTHFAEEPPEKVIALKERTDSSLEEAVADYVSGMTDEYAYAQCVDSKVQMPNSKK